jgi:hypothetical protein
MQTHPINRDQILTHLRTAMEPLCFPVGLADISIKRQQAQEFSDEMLKS